LLVPNCGAATRQQTTQHLVYFGKINLYCWSFYFSVAYVGEGTMKDQSIIPGHLTHEAKEFSIARMGT
jgi:hypothetical protein